MAPSLVQRHAQRAVELALGDTRVVAVLGARQVGKSTLVNAIATGSGWLTHTFDDQATREFAVRDPTGFVATFDRPVVIDEVQRAPDVLLAIKQRVDQDQRLGQFLLTGSANILTAPQISDALTGRAEYVRLGPLMQTELLAREPTFLDRLVSGHQFELPDQPVGRPAYADAIAAGGFPASLARAVSRRSAFFDAYLEGVLVRDLSSLAAVRDVRAVERLLRALAAISSAQLNTASLARDLGVAEGTVRAHLDLLETLFLVRRIPSWSNNLLARTVKAPKLVLCDAGMMLALVGGDRDRVIRDLDLGGALMETFVATELLRQAEFSVRRMDVFHFRDRDGREVDLVAEARDGAVAGIEIKVSASLTARDFRGLLHLRDKLGERFVQGVVLYTGAKILPFGDRLWAVPAAAVWGGGAPVGAL